MPDNTHDPIRDLKNFGTGGLTVNPLDPAEVRRLGDRHRARQRASMLVAASAVAVVVSIVPVTMLVAKDDAAPRPPLTTTTPTPTPTESPTVPAYGLGNIPETFPLDVDAPDYSGDGGETKGPGPRVETSTPELCNHDAITDAEPKGRLAFTSSGPEVREDRELRTYADDTAAEEVMTALRTDLDECSTWPSDATSDTGATINLTVTRIAAETGHDSETFAVTEVAPEGEGYAVGGTVYQVTRVGSAILTLAHNGEVSAQSAPSAGPGMIKTTRKITPEMCLFTTAGCGPRTITFPGGVMVEDTADAEKLVGASNEFKSFIVAEVARVAAEFGDQCPNRGIVVRKYRTDGLASGDVSGCSGYAAIWKEVDGVWKEVLSAQEAWNCADLERVDVPQSFAGECNEPPTSLPQGFFGPDEVLGLRLGMSEADVIAAGGYVTWPDGKDRCGFVFYPGTGPGTYKTANGYISTRGVENLDALTQDFMGLKAMATAKGIRKGSTRSQVEAAYPGGRFETYRTSWLVSTGPGTRYRFILDEDSKVSSFMLERADQGCYV